MDEAPPPTSGFIAPTLEELAPLFPAYVLEAFIAQGGMGAVYKARQKSLDRDVAIKILPREFGDDPQFRASFEAEAKAMARLNHPNLISVYDFGDIEGMLYIIMEFVQGKALYYSAHKKAIDPPVALDLVSTISRGLAHAHRSGIIHRDIKPANILLDMDATPKIGDFGLAHPVELKQTEGVVFGTPGYTAPEIFHQQPVDQRSDIFSVGALLYELLCGKHPTPESYGMTTGQDPRIDAILKKATQADPNLRYETVDQLADEIDALIPKLSAPRFAAPSARPLGGTPATSLASSKQKSSALPVLVILALLIGGGAAFLASNQKETPKPIVEKPEVKQPKKDRPNKPRPNKKDSMANKSEPVKPEPKPDKPEPEKPAENPLQSFDRLHAELKEGNFSELPIGAVKREKSAYFLHPIPMNATEAHLLAASSGASLAIASKPADLTFIRESLKPTETLWLGAADSGLEGKWYWVNGSPVSSSLWAPGAPNDDTTTSREGQDFAALTPTGLQDFARIDKFRPLLEWKLDGFNSGSLSAQLDRASASLSAKKSPVFPAATFEYKGSRYLLFKREYGYTQASNTAQKGGGHLAVLSSQVEAQYLTTFLKAVLKPEEGCWLGGSRNETSREIWETPTGEIFTFHKWLPDEPNDLDGKEDSLEYLYRSTEAGRGFNDSSNHVGNPYLLIEWSHPSLRNMPSASATDIDADDLLAALEEVRDKIRKRQGRAYRKFRREHDKIIEDFLEDTITYINDQERLSTTIKASLVEEVKKYLDRNELPETLPAGANRKLKDDLVKAKAELKQVKEDYKEDFQEAKQDYLDAVLDAGKAAATAGETPKGKMFILENTVTQDNDERFHSIMNNEEVPLPEEPKKEEEKEEAAGDDNQ
jgi:serine/threonine protein kinase